MELVENKNENNGNRSSNAEDASDIFDESSFPVGGSG